jgi:hypothetical protein
VLSPYDALVSLSGELNSQSIRYWNAENSGLTQEFPLHDKKIGACWKMGARREISTISGLELQRVNNGFRWYTKCIRSGGQFFSASAVALVIFI